MANYFFNFKVKSLNVDIEEHKVIEDVIYLPDHLLCICVSEHDLGKFKIDIY